jgi:hypothetical protein
MVTRRENRVAIDCGAVGQVAAKIGPKREGLVPGWWCTAEVAGRKYDLGVLVIPGTGARPDTWAVVRDESGKVIFQERAPASISAENILRLAGIT